MKRHIRPLQRLFLLLTALTITVGPACRCSEPSIEPDLSSPEAAAMSGARLLCAERLDRLEHIFDSFNRTKELQQAKARVLASPQMKSDRRLNELADFFEEHQKELLHCEAVLTDMEMMEGAKKAHVALRIEFNDWTRDGDGVLSLTQENKAVLFSVVKFDGEWKISASSVDIEHPRGALWSLLD